MGDVGVVVFDVDDTLYLEREYVRSGFASVAIVLAERTGVVGADVVMWRRFLEGERGSIFDSTLAELAVDQGVGLVGDLVATYRTHVPAIELLPDARACLSQLRGVVELAIVTDGPVESQRAKIVALGLEELASLVVVTGEHGVGFAKPGEPAFAMVEAHFGVAGSTCAYVADNPVKDFIGPLARGWAAVRVRRPGGLHGHLDGPVPEVTGLEDLVTVLGLGAR